MQTQVEELPENKVRLTVQVPVHDMKHAVDHAAHDLAGSVKIPGFRQGKIPMPVLLKRVGKERLMAEAVDSHIEGWFMNAAARSRVRPIERPDYEYELPASSDDEWSFTATVSVQPKPDVPDWRELEVPRPEAEVPSEAIDAELERLRHVAAALAPVERAAENGDVLVVDLESDGEAQRDYVVELGGGRLIEELEQGLVGMSAGDTRTVDYETSDDTRRTVNVSVKQVREKVLPDLADELARSASEFDTLEELRGSIEERLREQLDAEIEGAFRANVVDALVESAGVEAAGPLVESRTRELLQGFIRSIERRGVAIETYLAMTGRTSEELVASLRAEAAQSVARELVLDAVADQAGIDVSDEDVAALVREQATAEGEEDVDAVIDGLKHSGQFEQLREDLRMRDALDRVAAEVKPISMELAQARDAIWTPEQEKPAAGATLWTPGSKES